MPSTFLGLNTGMSGLNYYQATLNTNETFNKILENLAIVLEYIAKFSLCKALIISVPISAAAKPAYSLPKEFFVFSSVSSTIKFDILLPYLSYFGNAIFI